MKPEAKENLIAPILAVAITILGLGDANAPVT